LYKHYYNEETKDLREINSNISLDEGIELFKIIKQYKPKKVVEIGFAIGISTLFMLCALDNNAVLYSVDPFQKIQWNKFGLINVNNILEEQKLPYKMHKFIEKYSSNFFKETKELYDLVLIDGDHSYHGTMIDLYGADKILKKKGLMIIDDVLHYDVKKALANFLKKHNNFKKVDNNLSTMNFYIKN
jgi:predicted O-methyltransferase YrrM